MSNDDPAKGLEKLDFVITRVFDALAERVCQCWAGDLNPFADYLAKKERHIS